MLRNKTPYLILRRCLKIITDAVLISCAWIISFWLRFNLDYIPTDILWSCLYGLSVVLPIQYAVNIYFRVNKSIWRYTSIIDLINIILSAIVGTIIIYFVCTLVLSSHMFPRSIFFGYPLLLICMLGITRISYRLFYNNNFYNDEGLERVVIIGAGQAGADLTIDILRLRTYKLIGFLDDDIRKRKGNIHGFPVLGYTNEVANIKQKYAVNRFLIAIPSANSDNMRLIVALCQKSEVKFSTLPKLQDIVNGKVDVDLLRNVSIEDILGREQVDFDAKEFARFLPKHSVLITGAGGSIGSELSNQIAALNPSSLILIDNSEYNLYKLKESMKLMYRDLNISYFLCDVSDCVYVKHIFKSCKPDIVFHAAAYKHVSVLEGEKYAAIKNNVKGTLNVARASIDYDVEKFVFISTDKAINPLNTMGKSKKLGELLCQYYNTLNKTNFIAVRFGNVMGSVGSVIPKFKHQIRNGGPITVTDPNVKRFFMTISEASRLIIYALISSEKGGTYVLDMGSPINIKYLAEQMIKLAGKKPGLDIDIKFTGLEPGEKMEEYLYDSNETLIKTSHAKIMQVNHANFADNKSYIQKVIHILENNIWSKSELDFMLNSSTIPASQISEIKY